MRRRRWALATGAGAAAAAAALVLLNRSLDELDRPWGALLTAALVLAIVAVGYLSGRWPAVVLAVVCVAGAMVLNDMVVAADTPEDDGCERFCGLSLEGALAVTTPVVVVLSAAGVAARQLVDAVRRG